MIDIIIIKEMELKGFDETKINVTSKISDKTSLNY